ncbi:MAG TPA: hypothetical protein VKY15_01010, partial [Acidimicrobiales bacterium]|nr:hypothetical protein [Acidimicrobiales bacterium]
MATSLAAVTTALPTSFARAGPAGRARWPAGAKTAGPCENWAVLYDGGGIACDDDALVVRRYYPWG